jgi:hypothetical protein
LCRVKDNENVEGDPSPLNLSLNVRVVGKQVDELGFKHKQEEILEQGHCQRPLHRYLVEVHYKSWLPLSNVVAKQGSARHAKADRYHVSQKSHCPHNCLRRN